MYLLIILHAISLKIFLYASAIIILPAVCYQFAVEHDRTYIHTYRRNSYETIMCTLEYL